MESETPVTKSFHNVYNSGGSLKYKHCYVTFTVNQEQIEEGHNEFEEKMKEFIKKNKGKILHINKHKREETMIYYRCYFAVNRKDFPEWKEYTESIITTIMKPRSMPSFIEFN
ncbi:unnamed protein product [Moneuplotes crassus]|uniref:Uncharacterized protein n=1 Tax=Euplotes crassus TaxID=5936 RepID=A0AAD1Y3U8_EUPCR|nr:unnamed protein product [Moneuplotes crassus]